MVRNLFRYNSNLTLGLLLASALVAGCSSDDSPLEGGNNNNDNECLPDPECVGCVADGECCLFNLNCMAGRDCNLPTNDDFDPTLPENICIQVTCDTDEDCAEGRVCGRDKICRAPLCQVDEDCPGSEVCLNGGCQAAPTAEEVASCEVVTRDASLNTGGTLVLAAAAAADDGASIGGVTFEWTSSDPSVASIDGNVATAGATEGTATITARPAGGTTDCSGSVTMTNLGTVAAGSTRVVVAEDGVGTPVADALVIIDTADGAQTATTAADGTATVAVASADVTSVTVQKDGWQLFTVVQPGVEDIFIPLPRNPDVTVAGGFRGVMDQSLARGGDIRFGFVGPAIPTNVLDFGAEELVGDLLETEIDAPDLGIDSIVAPLPAGLIFSLGSQNFTATEDRCLGVTPGNEDLGCYLARTPAGPSAGWALGGRVRLMDVTGLIDELSGLLGDNPDPAEIPIGDILTGVLPLLRRFSHGIDASLSVGQFPKVDANGDTAACTDPTIDNYDEVCFADFSQYERRDLRLTQDLNVFSSVTVPTLPTASSGSCASGAVILSASNLEGRGLVPLGLGAGLARGETDCEVAGIQEPFGPDSNPLSDGQMALSMATPHSGLEGSQTLLLMLALDIDQLIASEGAGFQVSAIVNRVSRVDADQTLSGSFLPYPEGIVRKATAEVEFTSSLAGTTVTRAEIQGNGDTWLVYAPPNARVQLPNVARGRAIATDASSAVILTMKTENDAYGDVWRFGSGRTLDRLFDVVDSFVVSDCPEGDPDAACRLE